LTTTIPSQPGSATEDLCVNAQDSKANNTTPQQTTLIRECTSAALNLALTGSGSIAAGEIICSAAGNFPNINTVFDSCCMGPTSTCDRGLSATALDASNCATVLDNFNNQFDNTPFPTGFVNESANPTSCQIANGNLFMNPGRKLGPGK